MLTSGNPLARPCPESEISLYLHLPFCKRRCPYCHFYVAANEPQLHQPFIQLLLQELDLYQPLFRGRQLRSIYLGGGTPSLIAPELLDELLKGLFQRVGGSSSLEITLEANPETVTAAHTRCWKESGINRLSLGVQSLVERELLVLGRGHRPALALEAIETVAGAGFGSYSIDLMVETPYQELDSWRKTLEQVRAIRPPHLSLYNLVIEPGTVYAKRQQKLSPHLPSPELGRRLLEEAIEQLEQIGCERYEISAFAQKGHESIHNTGYWRGRAFLGLGPSAFSFIDGKRLQNIADLKQWSRAIGRAQGATALVDELSADARQAELLAVALRLRSGLDCISFEQRWGPLSDPLRCSIDDLCRQGLLLRSGELLRLSEQGELFYERVASELVLLESS